MDNTRRLTSALPLVLIAGFFASPAIAQEEEPTPLPTACTEPGDQILTDASGDAAAALGLGTNPLSMHDLTELSVWQEHSLESDPVIGFQLKVAAFETDPLPATGYFVTFLTPLQSTMGVRMNVDNEGVVTFFSYIAGGNINGDIDGRFIEPGSERPLLSGEWSADGTIRMRARAFTLRLSEPGESLHSFNAGVTRSVGTPDTGNFITDVLDSMLDGLGRLGSFEYLNPVACGIEEPDEESAGRNASLPANGAAPAPLGVGAGSTPAGLLVLALLGLARRRIRRR